MPLQHESIQAAGKTVVKKGQSAAVRGCEVPAKPASLKRVDVRGVAPRFESEEKVDKTK